MSASLEQGTKRRYGDFSTDDIDWLERTYGERSFSRVVGLLIKSFRAQHSFTLDKLAELGAAELKRKITSGELDTELDEGEGIQVSDI